MAGQVNQLRAKREPKPLYVKKIRYIGIKKLVERPEPYKITYMENYYPFRGESDRLKDSLRRVTSRRKTINIQIAATHEIHLAKATVTDSLDVTDDPKVDIAALVNIYGGTRQLLKNRPSGSSIYIHGEGTAYFVLTWKQAMEATRTPKNSKKQRKRMRYPTENFSRIEEGCKAYYLQKASPEEFAAIMEALKNG
jgi:hypothetical protein